MNRSPKLAVSVLLVMASSVLGCSSDVGVGSGTEAVTYTRTIVQLGKEGIISKRVIQIGAREKAVEQAAITAARNGDVSLSARTGATHTDGNNVAVDSSCAGSDLWMFDDVNLGGNELCIYATGSDAFAYYTDLGWDTTLSYWAGNQSGLFDDNRICRFEFYAGDTWHNVTTCAQANEVSFL